MRRRSRCGAMRLCCKQARLNAWALQSPGSPFQHLGMRLNFIVRHLTAKVLKLMLHVLLTISHCVCTICTIRCSSAALGQPIVDRVQRCHMHAHYAL